jgi:SAM-dependent methyltransferase
MEMFQQYNAAFFAAQSCGSLQSARLLLPEVFACLEPKRVIDIGCGVAAWLRVAADLGASDVLGVDGGYVDRSMLMVDPANFVAADLAVERLRDILRGRAEERFDLVMCLEVAEHLPYERAPSLVEDLTELGDAVLFAAAVPFQYGTGHINEQWPEFWAIQFRARGYSCYDWLRRRFWANSDVNWWYAQNVLLFVKDGSPTAARLPEEVRTDDRALAMVHPENFLVNLLQLYRTHRKCAYEEEAQDLRSLLHANSRRETVLPPSRAITRARAANVDARDVFPWTRSQVSQPDVVVEQLPNVEGDARDQAARCVTLEELARAEITRRELAEALTCKEANRVADVERRPRDATAQCVPALQRADAEAVRLNKLELQVATEKEQQRQARQSLLTKTAEVAALQAQVDQLQQELEIVISSTVWRASWPLRRVGSWLPRPVRRAIRGTVKLTWWTLTLRLPRRLAERRRVITLQQDSVRQAIALSSPEEALPSEEIPASPTSAGPVEFATGHLTNVAATTVNRAIERLRRFLPYAAEDYCWLNPDVLQAGADPETHAICSGAFEGRRLFTPERIARALSSALDGPAAPPKALSLSFADVGGRLGTVAIYASSLGHAFIREIAEDLAQDLSEIGVAAAVRDETSSPDPHPAISIFVCPDEFFTLGAGKSWIRDDVIKSAFVLGTEQVQTSWFGQALPFVLMSRGAIDMCFQTAELLRRAALPCLHFLPSSHRSQPGLTVTDRQHALYRILPPAAKLESDRATAFADRQLDIAFFGTESSKRHRFFAQHAAFLADFNNFIYLRPSMHGPIPLTGADASLTRLARHVSGHTKITLNVHQDVYSYFEWHRIVRLGMATGSVVVSEPCLPHPVFKPGTHYFEETGRQIPNLLDWLLRSPEGRAEAERVRRNVIALISDEQTARREAARLCVFLLEHTGR